MCSELYQVCTPLTLLSQCVFVYISNLSLEECLDSSAYTQNYIFILYIFNFSSTLKIIERDKIKLCRLTGDVGVTG